MLHRTRDTTNTYGGIVISQTTHTKELRMEDTHITLHPSDHPTACKQQSFHQRGSSRSGTWFSGTSPCEYSNNVFHTSNITASNLETLPCAKGTVYQDNLLSSIMIEQP